MGGGVSASSGVSGSNGEEWSVAELIPLEDDGPDRRNVDKHIK